MNSLVITPFLISITCFLGLVFGVFAEIVNFIEYIIHS